MSVQTDLAVLGPAAAEVATLLAAGLELAAVPGEGFDLWPESTPAGADILSRGAKVWSAQVIGPTGACGEIAIALPPGTNVPGEGRLASAMASAVTPLTAVCGADHIGDMSRPAPASLLQPRPGHQALAVPMLADGAEVGLLVVVLATTEATAELPHLDPSPGPVASPRSIAALSDVEMAVSVELGRTKVAIKDLLGIHNGAVVQLDRSVTQPVDIFVQGTLIARGEVVVVDECFAVRVTELLTGE